MQQYNFFSIAYYCTRNDFMLTLCMKINLWHWSKMTSDDKIKILKRSESGIEDVRDTVLSILEDVKSRGEDAIRDFSLKFDGADLTGIPLAVSPDEYIEAENSLSTEVKEAIQFAIKNIQKFHRRQTIESLPLEEILPGVWAGEKATPIESLAIYVPNGRGNFPSMLYMAAVPAQAAGVPRIVLVSPPNKLGKIDSATLYAAQLCGISEAYRIGGAQAIVAMAYGTETISPCAMITGPGSRYVTAAKRLLYGTVNVGLPAGPSESIVLADETADPYLIALDLLTEAEHGSDSSALLITPSQPLASAVSSEIDRQTATLGEERRKFVEDVMSGYGGIILTDDIAQAIEITNKIATEHLQIATTCPEEIEKQITNAGEILLGHTPFAVANYAIGPNAILPTGGNAKTFSAVSVRDFVKYSSIIKTTDIGVATLKPHIEALAQYEGFETHRNALTQRSKKEKTQ